LISIEKKDFTWFFTFGNDLSIATEGHWRLLTFDRIHVTSEDHGHPFGLPEPVDAAERVRSTVNGLTITNVELDSRSGDLAIQFGDASTAEFMQTSCGYESWRLFVDGDQTICLGGGSLMHFENRSRFANGAPK
jgi:hypothetical protein